MVYHLAANSLLKEVGWASGSTDLTIVANRTFGTNGFGYYVSWQSRLAIKPAKAIVMPWRVALTKLHCLFGWGLVVLVMLYIYIYQQPTALLAVYSWFSGKKPGAGSRCGRRSAQTSKPPWRHGVLFLCSSPLSIWAPESDSGAPNPK